MPDPASVRRRYRLRGQVQGVGFRPFIYRTAVAHGLAGWVANDTYGAALEVEGPAERLAAFEHDLYHRLPPLAHLTEVTVQDQPPRGEVGFRIVPSQTAGAGRPEVTPDAATCHDCLRELFDPADRRFRYAFTNCTNCGPRYSILRAVPYDRPNTTMAVFAMCPACAREYGEPADRRFHAQPNACAACGPELRLLVAGTAVARGDAALREAAERLAAGAIVAVKGIGGYHLACRADREDVVQTLRRRKLRDGKPLAVLVPDVATAERLAVLTPADVAALTSPAAPIVLAPRRGEWLAPSVAPGVADYGLLLPYAPVHHLLMASGLGPLVLTSANLSGHPLTYRDDEALAELGGVADAFLMHDREIARPIDDSVVFTFDGDVIPVRRARGYAPQPVPVDRPAGPAILAVGAELKAAVCLLDARDAIVSEHLGDLSNAPAYRHYLEAIARLEELTGIRPERLTCDLHPRYQSTVYARGRGLSCSPVQHHHAHVASVMAEHGEAGPVLGLACDGTGYGTDGAVWGCELLWCERGAFRRLGGHEYYPLLGGDAAAVETWRPAAALLRAALPTDWVELMTRLIGLWRDRSPGPRGAADVDGLPTAADLRRAEVQMARGVGAPPTSSLGRVFDAAAFVLGLAARNRHEAEGALAVEGAASGVEGAAALACEFRAADGGLRFSVAPALAELARRRLAGAPVATLAAALHETVAAALYGAVGAAVGATGVRTVALSGGCFANRRLLGRLVMMLRAAGLRVLYNRAVPAGDGGVALGQAYVAAWQAAGDG